MRKAQKVTRGAAGILLVILMVFAVVGCIPNSETSSEEQKYAELADQQSRVQSFFFNGDYRFVDLVKVKEGTDKEGNPCVVGVIDPKLDALLGDLAGAYNADPKTTKPLTEQELRYFLTDGIVETTRKERDMSAFHDFVLWTAADADLVYNKTLKDDSMNILHREGDAAPGKWTNYEFIKGQDDKCANYEYRN